MCNILDFIDSKDIREYNRSTHFYPIEQAVLIYLSRCTTVEEKLIALKELLDNYGEEDFLMTSSGIKKLCTMSNRDIVLHTVKSYEKALSDRYTSGKVVFEASFWERKYPNSVYTELFSDYDGAYKHIRLLKQGYLEDNELKLVETKAEIKIKALDEKGVGGTTFYFDNDLRMINILPEFEAETVGLDEFFVYVPLPFKKGDILRTIDREFYGILPRTPDKKYFKHGIKTGDISDMCVTLEEFYKDDGRWVFGWDHYDFLKLEFCPDDELPVENTIFFYLRDVYIGKMSAGELLHLYSHYGERAYTKFYGDDIK